MSSGGVAALDEAEREGMMRRGDVHLQERAGSGWPGVARPSDRSPDRCQFVVGPSSREFFYHGRLPQQYSNVLPSGSGVH